MTLSRAHALTADELALLRTRKPAARTDLFLAVWPQFRGVKGDPFNAIVWTGLVNEPLGTVDDRLFEIDYDGGSGAVDFAATLPDMTVYVGTTAGADDLGRARLRGWAAGATGVAGTMLLGEMSEIVWQDDAHLTVVDDFNLWPRHLYIDGAGIIYIDHGYYDEVAAANVDGAYTDQHAYPDPVPVLGPDAIKWMPDTGNARVYFDAENSFALDGGALTYTWSFPGSVANGGLAVAATWAEYNAAGVYRAACQVNRNYPPVSAFTGYRRVFVFDDDNMPTVKFSLQDCGGDYSSGGWSYRVQMWDEVTRAEIVDRARCILFARDWFDGVEQSVGPLVTDQHGGMTLRANVVCNGWVAGESIVWDNERGTVTFDVQGPQFWLDKMVGFPHGVENSDGVPTDWFEFQNLQVRDGLWSFLHWRTTATRMMDVELTADTREIAVFSTPIGSLWAQLVAGSLPAILAPPVCDRYGSLIVEIPVNHEFTASRAGTPTVLAMTVSDWRDQIDVERVVVPSRSMTDLSGVHYTDGTTATAFFSLAYGHIPRRYGAIGRQERLALFAAQATNNALCGLVQASESMEYPNVDYRLAGNYRVFDIVPRQRISQTILAGDTPRGIVWTDKLLLPRSVSFVIADGAMLVDMTCEEETGEAQAVDGEPPPETPPPPLLPPLEPIPPVEPTPPPVAVGAVIISYDQIAFCFDITVAAPIWYDGDPNGDLVGTYVNVAVTGDGKAYVTTRNDTVANSGGLWYCPDISAAITGTITWALRKSAWDALADTGYTSAGGATDPMPVTGCSFGSVWVNDSNVVGALVHAFGNNAPAAPGTCIYSGTDGVVAADVIGALATGFFKQESASNYFNHCMWGGAGSWYIGGRPSTQFRGYLAIGGIGGGWAFGDFWSVAGEQNLNCAGGVGGMVVGNSQQLYTGWDQNSPVVAANNVRNGLGVYQDFAGLHRLYVWDAGGKLYHDDVEIGDPAVEFNALAPSMAVFLPANSEEIVWLRGGSGAIATNPVLLYTAAAAGGATVWTDKTGNLAAILGANWNGYTSQAWGNAVVRTFEF